VEGWRAQDHCVVRAAWLLYFEPAFGTVVVCQRRACHCRSEEGHWLVSMADNFGPEAVVHILETPAVAVRWAGRIGMEGKVVDHSVEGAEEAFGWGGRIDVSWLVVPAIGNSMELEATSRPSCTFCPSRLAPPGVDLSSAVSICGEVQILQHRWHGQPGGRHCPEAPS
jgi:hypothetical protein